MLQGNRSTLVQGHSITSDTYVADGADLTCTSPLGTQTLEQSLHQHQCQCQSDPMFLWLREECPLSAPIALNHKAKAEQLSTPQTRLTFHEHTHLLLPQAR